MESPCPAGRLPGEFPSGWGADLFTMILCSRYEILLTCSRTSRVRALERMSGLYLHSPALEGMWMGALREHTGKVCLRLTSAPPSLDSTQYKTKGENS
jgi:hypothetical protein